MAVAARIWVARGAHLWFDEIYTLWVARRPLPELLRTVAGDIHPPLHYMLVSAWRQLGGEGDLWIKSLSILTGVLNVALLVAIGRDMFGRRVGILAAALLAIHPSHLGFSQESRSYALLFLALSFASWSAWRWVRSGTVRDGALYVLGAAVALYTHYLAGPVLAFVGLWGLAALSGDRKRWLHWIGLQLAVAIVFAPQMPTVLEQLHRLRADRWVKPPNLGSLFNVIRLLCLGPRYLIPPVIALAIFPFFHPGARRAASLLWLTSIVPLLLLWSFAMAGAGLFVERYMFFGLPAWCLLVAAGTMEIRQKALRIATIAILLVSATRAAWLHERQVEATQLARAEQWLSTRVKPGEIVVHADAHGLTFSRHYAMDAGTHLLLMTSPHLPYYEGELTIPEEWRVTPAYLDSLAASGRQWWGLSFRYGYLGAEPAAERIGEAAKGERWDSGRATAWAGQPGSGEARTFILVDTTRAGR